MKCDKLKVQKIGDLCFDFKVGKNIPPYYYRKSEVDEAIAELKEEVKKTQELANEQTFKLCVEKENVCQLEQLFQKQKDKADKLYHCLRCLVMRGLIKDCPEKDSVIEIVKEFK
ncbi:MAG: hypothetical protein UIG52_06690 [Bacteroidales bacterium]|nr:hypothetical protein [Bacteroidales bacterium]